VSRKKWLGNDVQAKKDKQLKNIESLKNANILAKRKIERLSREDYHTIIVQKAMRNMDKNIRRAQLNNNES
jgi:sialic acid synthase SpsE